MDVVILAGGKGKRMEDPLPKALVIAKGKTILAHQLDYLFKYNINKIILALAFKADQVIEYVKKNYKEKPIEFSLEEVRLGTGGAIKQALQKSTEKKVIVLNCDDITDINLEELKQANENTICVTNPRLPFGLVKETEGYAKFEEKPLLNDLWVSCGWYCFQREEILKYLPDKGSIEYETFPKVKLKVYYHKGFWQPLNSKKDIDTFEKS